MEDETEPARTGDGGCVGDGGEVAEGAPEDAGVRATPTEAREWARWPASAEKEVVRRVAAGESVLSVCRDPTMPRPSTIAVWIRKRPAFRAALADARAEASRVFGPPSVYCQETAEIIFERLCAGQALYRIVREDPTLPGLTTIYKWLGSNEEFRTAVALARDIAADGFFDKGWEMAEGATTETAYLTDVKLKHLRWHAGKLSPRKYGALKPVDPAPPHDEDDRNNLTVVVKNFVYDHPEDESGAEKVLYTMKRIPQTPAARRDAELARAEQRAEARAAAVREQAEARRREALASQPPPAPRPEKPWDPEGWT